MRKANYEIVEQSNDRVVIRDLGPWNKYLTVTNAAEKVVAELLPILKDRSLYYYDSEGQRDQIIIADGEFVGFASDNN